MGWLRRRWRAVKEHLFHLSLKRALALYIVLGAAATLVMLAVVASVSQELLNSLEWKYLSLYEEGLYAEMPAAPEVGDVPEGAVVPEEPVVPEGVVVSEDGEFYQMDTYNGYVEHLDEVYRDVYAGMSSTDRLLKEVLDFMQSWGVVICVAVGISGVCLLFYRNKLKRPLEILTDCAEKIAASNLDFVCEYEAGDEMGMLCAGFEKMRLSLGENHRKMWDMMEEQRRLNHAFAHDLRTPLTVLHGYIDFLEKYYPDGRVSGEKLMETLAMMDRQVLRLRRFGDTMKSVSSLEERRVQRRQISGSEIFRAVKSMAEALGGTGGVRIWAQRRMLPEQIFFLDEELFLEVAENLLSNGIRYAKEWVQVILAESGGFLEIYVKDDGPGFSEEGLHMAAKPYYRDKGEMDKEHFGIGLYICRVLCEKHGGFLGVHNSVDGGALLSAAFGAGEPEE